MGWTAPRYEAVSVKECWIVFTYGIVVVYCSGMQTYSVLISPIGRWDSRCVWTDFFSNSMEFFLASLFPVAYRLCYPLWCDVMG